MDANEPRVRRRGFFLHSDTTGEPDTGEHENPEGFVVRVRVRDDRLGVPRKLASNVTRDVSSEQLAGGRSRTEIRVVDEVGPQIRSGSVTGSRQRASTPRGPSARTPTRGPRRPPRLLRGGRIVRTAAPARRIPQSPPDLPSDDGARILPETESTRAPRCGPGCCRERAAGRAISPG